MARYFKDAAKSRCKGIISLEEAVVEDNPKQFDHRRELHCVKIFAQRSSTLASFKWWINRDFYFSFDSSETKQRFLDAVRQAQTMVVEGWTFCPPSSPSASESYTPHGRHFTLPKFEFVRSSSLSKALSGLSGSKSMRWLIDATDKVIGAVRSMKTSGQEHYPTAVLMKGCKYTPAGSAREVSEHEIPINSELYCPAPQPQTCFCATNHTSLQILRLPSRLHLQHLDKLQKRLPANSAQRAHQRLGLGLHAALRPNGTCWLPHTHIRGAAVALLQPEASAPQLH